MPGTFTIQLNNLRFFAKHGVYEEEKIIGNEFEVNISMQIDAPEETLTKIDDTVNYAKVYEIAGRVFSQPKSLLETVAMEMAKSILESFAGLKNISIQITKLHPPITSFTGSVSVTYTKDFI